TIQTDNSLTKWNIINSNKYLITPSISGITTTDNNIVIDTSGGQKSLTFNGTGDTAILGETNGDLGAYDITNARYIWFYDESANTLTSTATLTATNAALTTPTITSPVLNTGISGTAFLDEDDMVSDSATKAASQQSIKAYVDTQIVAQSPYVYEFSSANVLVSSNKGSFTSAKPSTGVYTVTHNLGTTDYVIIPGVRTDSYNITLISKGANDFQLSIRDAAGTRSDSNYMFSLWDNS
ncbi:MAG: hypothetical protein KJO69_06270, partial [Gammaproteobacteria bacterium]|nr:hypothetical protein [Gammaproteobacteria bacterium]